MCIQKDKVAFQNLFTLGLIALGLCFLREPIELGIFGKGNYNFPKLAKRLGQIKKKYPKTHKPCTSSPPGAAPYKVCGSLGTFS